MALNNFIPAIWSARLLANLNNTLVYAAPGVVNTDYEGEITALGGSVKINSIGRVTIGTYTKNTDITAPEDLTDAQSTLVIDQQKYFNFQVDDVDRIQQSPKVMDQAMQEAAYGLRNVADAYMAAKMAAEAASGNTLGSDASPYTVGIGGSDKNAYNLLVDLATALDDSNVPEAGRWVVVPGWFHGLLLKDTRFTAGGAPDWVAEVFNRGRVPVVGGLAVFTSNNVPNVSGAKYKIIAGHSIAGTFAQQAVNVEAYRPEKRFADAVKGLQLYGGKVVRPTALSMLVASKGTLN